MGGNCSVSIVTQGGRCFTFEEPEKFSVLVWIMQLVFKFVSESEARSFPPHPAVSPR